MTSISVVMATYNGALFLQQQLASLAAQSRLPDELVVTDDRSTDATLDILAEFSKSASFPVHVHRNAARLGYRANFMHALTLCGSDIIAFCDQDDVWEEGKIETAIQAFADPDVLLLFHDAWLIDGAGEMIGPARIFGLPPRNAPLSFFPLVNPFGFSIVFRQALTGFAKYWPASVDSVEATNRMAHDQWIFFLASVFGIIVYSDAKLIRYRQHGANAYGWDRQTGFRHRLSVMLRDNGADHRQFSLAAAARAAVLKAILATDPLPPGQRERAEACAAYYDALSRRLALRAEIYTSPHIYARVKAYLLLVRAGGYDRGTNWNIGPKAMLKDITLGLVFRPLMVRHTDPKARAAEHLRRDVKTTPS